MRGLMIAAGIGRGTWLVVRTLSRRLKTSRLLSFAGPAAMAGGFFGWVGSLWIGFALIYLPFADRFSYSETVPFGSKGIAEALYVSAASLTTVGFGEWAAARWSLAMAARLGWATWIVAHIVFGLVLGTLSVPRSGRAVDRDTLLA